MSRIRILGAATVAALLAVPALVVAASQDTTTAPSGAPPMSAPNSGMSPNSSMSPAAPSATDAGVNTNGVAISADQLPPGQAQALAAGDNKTVTNGPVPDTPANRAKYGKPMSHGGRKTPPAGN